MDDGFEGCASTLSRLPIFGGQSHHQREDKGVAFLCLIASATFVICNGSECNASASVVEKFLIVFVQRLTVHFRKTDDIRFNMIRTIEL